MKNEILKLKEKYRTYRELAKVLEITERYAQMIAKGQSVSKALEYRIRQEIARG